MAGPNQPLPINNGPSPWNEDESWIVQCHAALETTLSLAQKRLNRHEKMRDDWLLGGDQGKGEDHLSALNVRIEQLRKDTMVCSKDLQDCRNALDQCSAGGQQQVGDDNGSGSRGPPVPSSSRSRNKRSRGNKEEDSPERVPKERRLESQPSTNTNLPEDHNRLLSILTDTGMVKQINRQALPYEQGQDGQTLHEQERMKCLMSGWRLSQTQINRLGPTGSFYHCVSVVKKSYSAAPTSIQCAVAESQDILAKEEIHAWDLVANAIASLCTGVERLRLLITELHNDRLSEPSFQILDDVLKQFDQPLESITRAKASDQSKRERSP
ncbi:hypothetical protein PG993_002383 [Apiospora rasikravindrae]|uniref:Uncharacterized protein n=1 Tax=Apiospora rasikravindrae TaxID=990691 RepID=A0ABR1TWJ7_9PEZI